MKEEKPIIPEAISDIKMQTMTFDQIKDNWLVKAIIILLSISIALILLEFIVTMLMQIMPQSFVKTAMSMYNNNSTEAEMHISLANNFLLSTITLIYVLLTWNLTTQSKQAIGQSRKEQKIRDIENRLEKFYIPAEDILNGNLKKNHEQTINGWPPTNYSGLIDLRKYSYLADKETYEAYERYITISCVNLKSIACKDMDRDIKDYKCPKRSGSCMDNWKTCNENLKICEHFNECPTKDQDNIIINNLECKYYKKLKDAVTADIKRYKERLFKLKE